jgi:hypothetical protein
MRYVDNQAIRQSRLANTEIDSFTNASYITLEAGTKLKQQFTVLRDLLCAASIELRGIIDGMQGNLQNVVLPLTNTTPAVLKLFLDWLYTRRIPKGKYLEFRGGFATIVMASASYHWMTPPNMKSRISTMQTSNMRLIATRGSLVQSNCTFSLSSSMFLSCVEASSVRSGQVCIESVICSCIKT